MKNYLKKVVSIYTSCILTQRHQKMLKQLPQMSLIMQRQMFQTSSNKTEILGVPWNILTERISVSIKKFWQTVVTKRNSWYVSIHDPLGILSPCHVLRKVIYNFVMWKIRGMQKFLSILKTDLLNGWETYRVKKMKYQCQSH